MLYSGCSDAGGKGERSCADLRTDVVYVILSQRTELSESRVQSLYAIILIEHRESPRKRRGGEVGGGLCQERAWACDYPGDSDRMTARAKGSQRSRVHTFMHPGASRYPAIQSGKPPETTSNSECLLDS